ncbi:MAG: hypothetical protein DME76_06100 [Verrucomicrobia bacterium]|nr:MAG: hypothetical protein DME76_06100 [Verrucomicrobiota bacterium]
MNTSADSHDHERKDVDVPSLFIIAFFLALSCVVIFIVVTGMMRYFKAHEPAVTAGQPNIPVTRVLEFPPPRLLVRPGASLAELRAAEESDLNSRASGIARVPVDRAIQLLLQRGLPDVGAGQTPLSLMQARPAETATPPRLKMPNEQ